LSNDNLRGIFLMIASMAFFAVEDMFLKWAASSLPIGQVIFVSGAFGAVVFIGLAWVQGDAIFIKAAMHPAVFARNFGEMIGTLGYIIALASVPLTTVSAVLQAMPLAVTMGAALFLGEKVGWRRWCAIAVGFFGVLLVIKPGLDQFRPEALWVLLTVAGLALRDLAARLVPAAYSNSQVSAWGLLSIALLGIIVMLVQAEVHVPDASQTAVLFGALVFGTVGYWAITGATRCGEISVVSPFRYTRLLFALIIGAVAFSEYPDAMTLCGALMIIGSGIYAFMRERARKRTLSTP
jgi:drug/metabolite transporter (DMT)-like permease